jgi:membrane protease YdiL (CAAX protease family)
MNNTGLNHQIPNSQAKWTWQEIILIPIGFGIIFIIGWIVLSAILRQFGVDLSLNAEPTFAQTIALAGMETVALVGSVYQLGMLRRGISWKELGLKSLNNRWLLIAVTISLLAIPITGLITLLVLQVFDLPFENPQLDFFLPQGISLPAIVWVIIFGGITVPFAEELFFRGVLYRWLRKHWSMWPSIILSALIFGAIHLDIAVGLTAFILGMVLAWIYERSQNLWAPFLIHALNNSLRLLLLYILVALGLMP